MSGKEYLGYPEYVVITLPKCGTKTMNKCFTSLGYKGNKITCSPSSVDQGPWFPSQTS